MALSTSSMSKESKSRERNRRRGHILHGMQKAVQSFVDLLTGWWQLHILLWGNSTGTDHIHFDLDQGAGERVATSFLQRPLDSQVPPVYHGRRKPFGQCTTTALRGHVLDDHLNASILKGSLHLFKTLQLKMVVPLICSGTGR